MISVLSWQNSGSPASFFFPSSNMPITLKYLLTSYFCIPVPFDEKDIFFWLLVLEDLVGLHRTIQLQLLKH